MLLDFKHKIRMLQKFDADVEIEDIVRKNAYYLTGLLRLQLQKGKTGNDENITLFGRDFYADSTIAHKERDGVDLGKLTEWVTLYMSGAFYASLRVEAEGENFDIISDVPYFGEIVRRSGQAVMELNRNAIKEFVEEIVIPELKRRFNEQFRRG